MRLFTAAEQRELDALAAEAGLPTRVLMESSGAAVARAAAALRPRRAIVFCGPGNNGGDGFVCARFLRLDVDDVVVVATAREKLKGIALEAARAWDGPVVDVAHAPAAGRGDVVLDAVFGSGLSRPPGGAEAAAIAAMNEARERGAFVVAVDIPSGADSDRGALYPVHLAGADLTVTLHAPKRGLYLHPAAAIAGRIEVAPIGIPPALEEKLSATACELIDEEWGRAFAVPRKTTAHKNDFGHVLAVAGSPGKSGAAALLVEAALRAGAGLVTLAARPEVLQSALPGVPEAMGWALPGSGPLGPSDLPALRDAVRGKTALAIGPGIPRGPQTAETIGELLGALDGGCAAVLDADALNALAEHRDRIAEWLRRAPVRPVLTPHPGEFARLTGEEIERIEGDRIDSAVRAAQRFGACIVLKGAHTVIADPEGTAGVCGRGNPGMATAGAGDVLTGIASAVLAQRAGPGGTGERARFAVLLHALAGDLAARRTGQAPLVAHDIARTGLPRLFRRWNR
jgi:ADP-dependent NAD(P)H-hydrate dehydratase / NAD(P)H-hydrate epimerase